MFKSLPSSADKKIIDIVNSEMNPSFEKALGYSVMDSSNGDEKVSR